MSLETAPCTKASDGIHIWMPMPDVSKPSDQWSWSCKGCRWWAAVRPASVTPFISKKVMEDMVDSSLKVADRVFEDDQSLKGELWLMRNARWKYKPYQFQVVYHVICGGMFVVLFRYSLLKGQMAWLNITDTDTYREVLLSADKWRVAQP